MLSLLLEFTEILSHKVFYNTVSQIVGWQPLCNYTVQLVNVLLECFTIMITVIRVLQ